MQFVQFAFFPNKIPPTCKNIVLLSDRVTLLKISLKMKYTLFFFSALAVIWIKYAEALQTDYMDSYKTKIDLGDTNSGLRSSGILISHSGLSYPTNRNKTLFVSAPSGYNLLVSIRLIDFRPYGQDSLKIFAVYGEVSPVTYTNYYGFRNRRFYPSEEQTFYSRNGKIGITFTTGPEFSSIGYDGFELVYTTQSQYSWCSSSRTFRCRNGMCIADILKCDGHNHCGDQSSEKNCTPYFPSSGSTIGITFGGIFLCIAIACGVFIVIRRARRAATDTETIISTHPPPPTNLPSYPPPYPPADTYYPPPPPPYSQGSTNPIYH